MNLASPFRRQKLVSLLLLLFTAAFSLQGSLVSAQGSLPPSQAPTVSAAPTTAAPTKAPEPRCSECCRCNKLGTKALRAEFAGKEKGTPQYKNAENKCLRVCKNRQKNKQFRLRPILRTNQCRIFCKRAAVGTKRRIRQFCEEYEYCKKKPRTARPTQAPTISLLPTAPANDNIDDIPTQAPSISLIPTASTLFIDPLMEFLEDSEVSFDRDPSSPNFKAVKWLADEAQIGSTADGVNSTYGNGLKLSPRLIQRFALLTLQFALESSDGFAVKNLDECQWGGVTCADVGNRTGYVNEINFSYSGMTGTIPPEIKLLKDLVKLDLSNNNLQGSIPEALYRLTGLEEITLFKNQLTGKLSNSLGNLWSLNRLHLSHNELSGSIPNSFKSGQIIRPIKFLSLYSNKFSGTIPNALRFRELRYADLARNQFSGTIPDDIGEKWVWGRYIWLDHNNFTGTIPDSFAGMGNGRVEILTFNNNKLSGTVPGQFYLNKLLEFNVENNMFTRIDSNLCKQSVFKGREMVEFKAECDICNCNPFCKNQCADPTNTWSVVIVGAGASGLAAAHRLQSEGIDDVLVVEANDNIGGRARKDTTYAGFSIDLGPSYIHNTFKDELEELTGNNNLPLVQFPNSRRFLGGRGDGYVWRNYTYQDMFTDYFTPPNLELNCWVEAIDYDNNFDETIGVHCEDGRSFRAQRVIVTVPLSVLKDGDIDFTPSLPREVNRRASARPWQKGFKIYLEFDDNFYGSRDYFCVASSGYPENRCSTQRSGEVLMWDFSRFSAPDPSNAPNIVAGYFIGVRADEFEGLLESELVRSVVDKIGDYWNVNAESAYISHYLEYWTDDPFIRGTYSGYSDDNRANWVIDVDDKLYFAGEAFPVNGESQAWVHTAMHSGFDAADKILANPPEVLYLREDRDSVPTDRPTEEPTEEPTDEPTDEPTEEPTEEP